MKAWFRGIEKGRTVLLFPNYCLGMIGIIYSKGGCKEINKIIYIIIWFIK